MISGVVDTNILIELYRKLPDASQWISLQTNLAITSISWLEFMEGARGKAGQIDCQRIIAPFAIVYLTEDDQRWAMNQILTYRLSYGVSFKDCLIGSACQRLQVPLYTKNVKDFVPVLDRKLVIRPY